LQLKKLIVFGFYVVYLWILFVNIWIFATPSFQVTAMSPDKEQSNILVECNGFEPVDFSQYRTMTSEMFATENPGRITDQQYGTDRVDPLIGMGMVS
jgi:hypothetical protein